MLDYHALDDLRRHDPGWRLLAADSAPLVASFLHRVFLQRGARSYPQGELTELLTDQLFVLREARGEEAFPRSAGAYLDEWSSDDHRWLRKYYPPGTDEPHFDLTPATEKVLVWLEGLEKRPFVGAESRLLTLMELLRQMVEGAETDPEVRLRDLHRRIEDLQEEIRRIQEGRIPLMDPRALTERFLQFSATARELLGDFREVEQNFRDLDRRVRERMAAHRGGKGELLDTVLGERDAIADSDQGKSFRAFWDFLMSPAWQEEWSRHLGRVLDLEPVRALGPDERLRRVQDDWLEAGEQTQRTVARLSQQLRRFLDDRAWVENRRVLELVRGIERAALGLRETPPQGDFAFLPGVAAELGLPLERRLYSPPPRPAEVGILREGLEGEDLDLLFAHREVDRRALKERIRLFLSARDGGTLGELLARHPLEMGLAELVVYLQLAAEDPRARFDDQAQEIVAWEGKDGRREARIPRIRFGR